MFNYWVFDCRVGILKMRQLGRTGEKNDESTAGFGRAKNRSGPLFT
jgi:hypothetical protein